MQETIRARVLPSKFTAHYHFDGYVSDELKDFLLSIDSDTLGELQRDHGFTITDEGRAVWDFSCERESGKTYKITDPSTFEGHFYDLQNKLSTLATEMGRPEYNPFIELNSTLKASAKRFSIENPAYTNQPVKMFEKTDVIPKYFGQPDERGNITCDVAFLKDTSTTNERALKMLLDTSNLGRYCLASSKNPNMCYIVIPPSKMVECMADNNLSNLDEFNLYINSRMHDFATYLNTMTSDLTTDLSKAEISIDVPIDFDDAFVSTVAAMGDMYDTHIAESEPIYGGHRYHLWSSCVEGKDGEVYTSANLILKAAINNFNNGLAEYLNENEEVKSGAVSTEAYLAKLANNLPKIVDIAHGMDIDSGVRIIDTPIDYTNGFGVGDRASYMDMSASEVPE